MMDNNVWLYSDGIKGVSKSMQNKNVASDIKGKLYVVNTYVKLINADSLIYSSISQDFKGLAETPGSSSAVFVWMMHRHIW